MPALTYDVTPSPTTTDVVPEGAPYGATPSPTTTTTQVPGPQQQQQLPTTGAADTAIVIGTVAVMIGAVLAYLAHRLRRNDT